MTVIIFTIFKNVNFNGSVLLNNSLWFVISIALLFAVIRANFKIVGAIIEVVDKMAQGDLIRKVSVEKINGYQNLCSSINLFLMKVRKMINESTTMTDKVINYCEDLSKNARLAEMAASETYSTIVEVSADMTA